MKFRTVAKFTFGLALAGLVMEGSLRLIQATPLWRVLPVVPPLLGEPDPETGYVLTPNVTGIWVRENRAPIRINSLGMRDSEISEEKPEGTIRVALTGDSIVEAVQVEQRLTFDALAEKELTARGLKVEIANLAMSGHGPLRQLVRLRRRAPQLQPDMALSFIKPGDFLTTELFDDSMHPAYVGDSNGGLKIGTAFRHRFNVRHIEHPVFRGIFWAMQNIELARMAYWLYKNASIRVQKAQAAAGDRTRSAQKLIDKTCQHAAIKAQQRLWLEKEPLENWRRTEKFMDDYARWAAGINMPVMVALSLPYPPEKSRPCKSEHRMREPVIKAVMREFSRRGLTPVDFDKLVMQNIDRPDGPLKIYGFRYNREGHLNIDGHQVYAYIVAEELVRFITSRNLVNPKS